MVTVQKVDCTHTEDVIDFLSNYREQWSGTDWHKLFDYRWERNENYCGFALKDGDVTVGFIGVIFSQRRINGGVEKFCNLTSWIVKEEYRSRSISLLLSVLKMKDYTITDLTPSRRVYQIQNKLGFKDLDAKGRILLPFGRRLLQPKHTVTDIAHDKTVIEKKLKGVDAKIFSDHERYQCSHFLLTSKDSYCYVIYTKEQRKRLPYAHIHYISDLDLFSLTHPYSRKSILSKSGAYFIVIDSRLVHSLRLPFSFSLPFRAPKQFISSHLKPKQIDNLYSELILLNLRCHPRLKYLIRDYRQKIFGKKTSITRRRRKF